MKKLLFLCFIFLSLNTHALDSNKLINLDDLKILFDLQKNDWNENVLFLIKKNSFSKVDNDSDVFYLKSIFNDGEIITMPIFSKDIVEKIISIVGNGKPLYGNRKLRKGESESLYPDIGYAKEYLSWEPKTSLEEGINEVIKKMQEN